jgi:hypothetical protein
VKALSFRLLKNATVNGPQVAGFLGGVQDNPPTSVAQLGEVIPSCYLGNLQTVNSEWIRVPKADLAGPFPWYKTIAGSADPTEESPGYIVVVGTGTDTFYVEFRGVFTFKVSLATANTPVALEARRKIREERRLRAIAQEKEVLLKILSTASTLEGLSLNQKASV